MIKAGQRPAAERFAPSTAKRDEAGKGAAQRGRERRARSGQQGAGDVCPEGRRTEHLKHRAGSGLGHCGADGAEERWGLTHDVQSPSMSTAPSTGRPPKSKGVAGGIV